MKVDRDEGVVAGNAHLGISEGDVLLVDRNIKPALGRLVLAVASKGKFFVCRFTEHEGKQFLIHGEGKHAVREITYGNDVYI